MQETQYLIVGASHAALSALQAIRMQDAEGSVTLVTRDDALPYSPTVLPYVVSGRSAPERVAPPRMGAEDLPLLGDAPGDYVKQK